MTKPGANVEAVAALWAQGLGVQVIATRLGLSVDAVKRVAIQNRDQCPARRPSPGSGPSKEIVDRAAGLWAEGFSASEIGAALGITKNTVLGLASRNRSRFPMRGNGHGHAITLPVSHHGEGMPRVRLGRVSLPAMSWDRREAARPSPSD